jgi:hypothetical protein
MTTTFSRASAGRCASTKNRTEVARRSASATGVNPFWLARLERLAPGLSPGSVRIEIDDGPTLDLSVGKRRIRALRFGLAGQQEE